MYEPYPRGKLCFAGMYAVTSESQFNWTHLSINGYVQPLGLMPSINLCKVNKEYLRI
jgi:hypothetical protein